MKSPVKRTFRVVLPVLVYPAVALFVLWAFGAIWYDFPKPLGKPLSLVFLISVPVLWFFTGRRFRWFAPVLPFVVMAIWLTQKPRADRDWLPDVSKRAYAEINGDEIVFHNVRNIDYRTETEFDPVWETRKVRLSELTGIDVAITYWGSPYIAHPILSFQFENSPPICFSIETRKEEGESYSSIGGIYRQYELIYIVADESDIIRLRSDFREGEDVYLYHLNISSGKARERFMEYVTTLNELKEKPRWYNAITTNCTTSIRSQHSSSERPGWDWRLLVNGLADNMLYENGALRTGGLSFVELKKRSLVKSASVTLSSAPDFSRRIREDLPVK